MRKLIVSGIVIACVSLGTPVYAGSIHEWLSGKEDFFPCSHQEPEVANINQGNGKVTLTQKSMSAVTNHYQFVQSVAVVLKNYFYWHSPYHFVGKARENPFGIKEAVNSNVESNLEFTAGGSAGAMQDAPVSSYDIILSTFKPELSSKLKSFPKDDVKI